MTDSRTTDPFEFWRQLYEANEPAWTKAIKDVLTSPDYAEAQGKMLETFLAFQKIMRDGMSAQLSSFNLPTRDDVSRLGEIIVSLEEKVDQLDDHLATLEDRMANPAPAGERAGPTRAAAPAAPARARRASAAPPAPTEEAEGPAPAGPAE